MIEFGSGFGRRISLYADTDTYVASLHRAVVLYGNHPLIL